MSWLFLILTQIALHTKIFIMNKELTTFIGILILSIMFFITLLAVGGTGNPIHNSDYQLDVHTKVDTVIVWDNKRIVGQIPLWDSSKLSKLLYKDNE